MRSTLVAAVALLGATTAATAMTAGDYEIPYGVIAGSYLQADDARDADGDVGIRLSYGVPLDTENRVLEVSLFNATYSTNLPDSIALDGISRGVTLDYAIGRPLGRSLFAPKMFALVGGGLLEHGSEDTKNLNVTVNAGGGVMIPLGRRGWAVRIEGRAVTTLNGENPANCRSLSPTCDPAEATLVDVHGSIGLQIPLSNYFDKPVPRTAPQDQCDVAVVSVGGEREGCRVDTDRDGVIDGRDRCPETAADVAVDSAGCPAASAADADRDGVADFADLCASTLPGLRVNATGCAGVQVLKLHGVWFAAGSAELSDEARSALEAVVVALKGQTTMRVELAGYANERGNVAGNVKLAQQRAEAVRSYLIQGGIAAARLQARGYDGSGEANDADARRVDYRVILE